MRALSCCLPLPLPLTRQVNHRGLCHKAVHPRGNCLREGHTIPSERMRVRDAAVVCASLQCAVWSVTTAHISLSRILYLRPNTAPLKQCKPNYRYHATKAPPSFLPPSRTYLYTYPYLGHCRIPHYLTVIKLRNPITRKVRMHHHHESQYIATFKIMWFRIRLYGRKLCNTKCR